MPLNIGNTPLAGISFGERYLSTQLYAHLGV